MNGKSSGLGGSYACALFAALMLGIAGTFFTSVSFNDAASAAYAVVLLVPSAIILFVITDEPPRNKRRRGRLR
jgi:hypothetical protein